MSKLDTLNSLIRIGSSQPAKMKKLSSALKLTAKYGLVGLRDRLHEEIVADEVASVSETAEPGSIEGSITFSILMPTYNVDVKWVARAIDSVERQSYGEWELCIADDASSSEELKTYLASRQNDKVKVSFCTENGGISAASNCAAAMATGDYFVLLDNDDIIAPNALYELFLRASTAQADILYSDNDVIDENDKRLSLLFKPDWSPDLMLSQMYVGHLLAFRRTLFEAVGGFRSEFDGSQDYDLFLRMMARTGNIEHIARVLYSWRALPSSTATNPDAKPYAQTAGLNAIQSYLDTRYGAGYARARETDDLYVYDVRYPVPAEVSASIIIPTKDHVDDLKKAIDSIFERTEYQNYEILVVDNNSELPTTLEYFKKLAFAHPNARVIDAPIAFNWSKLNNLAAREAAGDVLVFLNNDTEVLSPDWLTRLIEHALREDIGVVGGLLTYPDGTIQHAGVVVGMGGWADHVYKGCQPVHYGDPFISPMVTRDVSAVTGACMAISRPHFDALGGFNEDFIVCGSDVELCLHARELGLRNIYCPYIALTHFESKTRDARDIPEIDFKLSEAMYRPFSTTGDPYYNLNLDYSTCVPVALTEREILHGKIQRSMDVSLHETRPLHLKSSSRVENRLNILLPSINPEDVYGGISTALKFYNALLAELGWEGRVIVLDAEPRMGELGASFEGYVSVRYGDESDAPFQVVSACNRQSGALPHTSGDRFICTCWWSAYCLQEALGEQVFAGVNVPPLLYLIQDYEPGFYPWSSRYTLAESTYRSDVPTIAIFNSDELRMFFNNQGYSFSREFVFAPFLNASMAGCLRRLGGKTAKRRQILVYGRPGTDRNAFELIVDTLRRWIEIDDSHTEWHVFSAGEEHPPVYLGGGTYLTPLGKLSLEQYARVLTETYAGLSYMVSPHPSYPPLEMAAFGVKVITNGYGNKDLSEFSPNVTSLPVLTPGAAARCLKVLCESYQAEQPCSNVPGWYLKSDMPFDFIPELAELLRHTSV